MVAKLFLFHVVAAVFFPCSFVVVYQPSAGGRETSQGATSSTRGGWKGWAFGRLGQLMLSPVACDATPVSPELPVRHTCFSTKQPGPQTLSSATTFANIGGVEHLQGQGATASTDFSRHSRPTGIGEAGCTNLTGFRV